MIKIKDIKMVRRFEDTKQALVRVLIEDDEGDVHSFIADAWEILDEKRLKEILQYWENVVIPGRKKVAKMTDEELEIELEKLKSKVKGERNEPEETI